MLTFENLRLPMDEEYIKWLGVAVYSFAYMEGTVIDIYRFLDDSFAQKYFRGEKGITSGCLKSHFKSFLDKNKSSIALPVGVTIQDIERVFDEFHDLTEKRNALIHAHPITLPSGGRGLAFQTGKPKAKEKDVLWELNEIKKFCEIIENKVSDFSKVADPFKKTIEI
ncbi:MULTISPECIES: hypothetical protein [unclassified Acinetobacter]|uniref:hypothetical protein n=1 Tax=unclassified Acinetobacter TaxID=196816 RepID=UPI0015D407CB|nr:MULTISPECIES: hypothetical protein [unclassified Acinetobacter]MCO8046366.1 hypothetical protein [Acinetobacter sp. S4397-1]